MVRRECRGRKTAILFCLECRDYQSPPIIPFLLPVPTCRQQEQNMRMMSYVVVAVKRQHVALPGGILQHFGSQVRRYIRYISCKSSCNSSMKTLQTSKWGFRKFGITFCGPHMMRKESVLASILGSPCWWKP